MRNVLLDGMEIEYLRPDEVVKILDVLPELGPRNEVALQLLLNTGMRGEEVLALVTRDIEIRIRPDDGRVEGMIDLRRRQIRTPELIRESHGRPVYNSGEDHFSEARGKVIKGRKITAELYDRGGLTGERFRGTPREVYEYLQEHDYGMYAILRGLKASEAARTIPCTDGATLGLLQRWIEGREARAFLFPSRQGGALGQLALKDQVHRAFKKAGVELKVRTGTHVFRHTFAVNYLRFGGQLAHLQRILGHTDIRTTAIYLQFVTEDLAEGMRQVGSIYRPQERGGKENVKALLAELLKQL